MMSGPRSRERGASEFKVSKHKTISSGANTFLLQDELIGSVDLGPKMCGVSTFINDIFVMVCFLSDPGPIIVYPCN